MYIYIYIYISREQTHHLSVFDSFVPLLENHFMFSLYATKEKSVLYFAQSAVKYTDCTSAEGEDSSNECPRYDIKQSDGEVPVMLELWGMRIAPSLPSLPCPLWSGVVISDRVLSMSEIELNYVLVLNWIMWNGIGFFFFFFFI